MLEACGLESKLWRAIMMATGGLTAIHDRTSDLNGVLLC